MKLSEILLEEYNRNLDTLNENKEKAKTIKVENEDSEDAQYIYAFINTSKMFLKKIGLEYMEAVKIENVMESQKQNKPIKRECVEHKPVGMPGFRVICVQCSKELSFNEKCKEWELHK